MKWAWKRETPTWPIPEKLDLCQRHPKQLSLILIDSDCRHFWWFGHITHHYICARPWSPFVHENSPDLRSGWHTRSIMYKYATFQFRCIQLMFQEKSVLLVADQLSGMRNYFWKTALCKMGNEIGACETWQSKAQAHDLKRCTLISLITLPRPIWWINSLWPFIFSCLTPIRSTKTHRWQSSIESRSPRSGIFAANWQGHEHIWTSNFSTNYVRKNSLSLGVNGSVSDFKHRKTPYCFSLLKL